MNVSELGEFPLIDRLAAIAGAEPPADLIAGIGDDAAAWQSGDTVLLATTDTLVEGVHFLPEFAPWAGRRLEGARCQRQRHRGDGR